MYEAKRKEETYHRFFLTLPASLLDISINCTIAMSSAPTFLPSRKATQGPTHSPPPPPSQQGIPLPEITSLFDLVQTEAPEFGSSRTPDACAKLVIPKAYCTARMARPKAQKIDILSRPSRTCRGGLRCPSGDEMGSRSHDYRYNERESDCHGTTHAARNSRKRLERRNGNRPATLIKRRRQQRTKPQTRPRRARSQVAQREILARRFNIQPQGRGEATLVHQS